MDYRNEFKMPVAGVPPSISGRKIRRRRGQVGDQPPDYDAHYNHKPPGPEVSGGRLGDGDCHSDADEVLGELDDALNDVQDAFSHLDVCDHHMGRTRKQKSGKAVSSKYSLTNLLAKLKGDRHSVTSAKGREPRSRKEYHQAMEKLRNPAPDFWSDEVKANKKVEAAARAMVRRARTAMPKNASAVPAAGEHRSDFIGIVMPMGHGKSTLAKEEGWVEFDSLITPSKRGELLEEVFSRIVGGSTFAEAMLVMVEEASKTLGLLRPQRKWVLLAQDASLLAALNVECVGGIIINPAVVKEANQHRSEHERLLIDSNMEEVYAERLASGGLELATTYEEARMHCYGYCLMNGIAVSRPSDFGLTDGFMSTGPGLVSGRVDLEAMVNAYDQGIVPRESVDHQVFVHKVGSYKGFGFTPNRWAKLMSRITATIGDDSFADADWNPSILSLDTFSQHTDLSEHEDVQYILSAQKGEHERFVLGLILHWKGIGMHCGLGNKLLPFYGVRRCHWSSVMASLRDGVIASGTFMGLELTMDERDHLLSLGLLVGGSLKDLRTQMYSMKESQPRASPSRMMEHKIVRQLGEIAFHKPRPADDFTLLGRLLEDSKIGTLEHLKWQLGPDTGPMPLNELIALNIGVELAQRWRGNEEDLTAIPGIMHKLVTKWYRVSVLRDEWSDFIHRILTSEMKSTGLAQAIAQICSCDPVSGRTGLDWGLRVCEALKGFIVCCIVAPPKSLVGVVVENGKHRPCVGGMTEGELWAGIIRGNIPKHALGVFGGAISSLALANELCKWKANPTVAMIEMINLKSWDPTLGPKRTATIIYRWARICKGVVSDAILRYMLDTHCRVLFSHSYSRIAARLEMYARLKASDGGLGCHLEYSNKGRVDKTDRHGGWSGTGAIVTDSEHGLKNRKTLEDRIRDFQDHEFQYSPTKDPKLALNLCGPVVCSILSEQGKAALNSNALLLHQLAGQEARW